MNSTTNMIFTPIEELPKPPQWMLDELEKETAKYNFSLLQQIFTIRECRPIRLAVREKISRTPSAIAIHEALENPEVSYYKNNISKLKAEENKIKIHFTDSIDIEHNEEFYDVIKYKKRSSSGHAVKEGMWKMTEKLFSIWTSEVRSGYRKKDDRLIKMGFMKWLILNLKHLEKKRNRKRNISSWECKLPGNNFMGMIQEEDDIIAF